MQIGNGHQRYWARGILILLTGIVGCSSGDEVETVTVEGTVTLNGDRLEGGSGSISFVPVDGTGQTFGGPIEDGKYTAEVSPGEKQVIIRYSKVVRQEKMYEQDPNSPMRDVLEEQIPARYNNNSELKVTISPDQTEHNFPLEK